MKSSLSWLNWLGLLLDEFAFKREYEYPPLASNWCHHLCTVDGFGIFWSPMVRPIRSSSAAIYLLWPRDIPSFFRAAIYSVLRFTSRWYFSGKLARSVLEWIASCKLWVISSLLDENASAILTCPLAKSIQKSSLVIMVLLRVLISSNVSEVLSIATSSWNSSYWVITRPSFNWKVFMLILNARSIGSRRIFIWL